MGLSSFSSSVALLIVAVLSFSHSTTTKMRAAIHPIFLHRVCVAALGIKALIRIRGVCAKSTLINIFRHIFNYKASPGKREGLGSTDRHQAGPETREGLGSEDRNRSCVIVISLRGLFDLIPSTALLFLFARRFIIIFVGLLFW
jgi:hypothetical protein